MRPTPVEHNIKLPDLAPPPLPSNSRQAPAKLILVILVLMYGCRDVQGVETEILKFDTVAMLPHDHAANGGPAVDITAKIAPGTSFQYPPWSAVADEDNSPDWAARSPDVELWTDVDKDIIRKAVEEATMTLKLARYPRNHRGEVGRGDEEFAERWMKRMFSSTVKYTSDAIVALLLCYLPNLESFKVDTYNDDRLGLRGFTFTYRVLSSLAYNDNATHLHTIGLSLTNSLVRPILLRHLISTFSSLNIKNFSYAVLRPRQTHASGKRWPAATVISPDDITTSLPNYLCASRIWHLVSYTVIVMARLSPGTPIGSWDVLGWALGASCGHWRGSSN
ncbi:hypothetical protein DL95DRAFT_469904 [Leptodontidium sp. 2 PMI_412]|nr:hypothetical protein DL95DRAFT_469904 [Leptodontidium sp. 2 PMI_412]